MIDVKNGPSDAQKFEYMEMFNQIVILDENFVARLPDQEFELAFDSSGNIYIDGEPLEINVKHRHEALQISN